MPEASCLLGRGRLPRAGKGRGVLAGGEGERLVRFGGVVGVRRRGACVLPPQAGVRGVLGTDGQVGRLPGPRLNESLRPVRIAISVLNFCVAM